MAYKQVLFEDNMETQAGDFNNMQDFINSSMDYLVADAIEPGNAYVGLGITKAAATQVSINIGRLYWGGKMYSLDDPVIIDFQTVAGGMPVTQQRQIAIVAYGQTVNSDTEPRNFVVDADTGQAQSESVSMLKEQVCLIGPIPGVESPSPSYPAIPATNLLIGYVLLNPAGVVSIQQITLTQLPNAANHEVRITILESEFALAESQIATLQTALAALAAQLANYVTLAMFQKLVDLVNQIWLLVNRPPNYALDTIDNFFDTSQSAVGTNVDGAYNANVAEGIRFNPGGTATTSLHLLNPTEPVIQAWDTFVLPKPSGTRVRMDCSFSALDWVAEPCLNHPYWVFAPRKLGWARERFRCGVPFLPCPQPAVFAYGGPFDPIYVNLQFVGESWVVVPNSKIVQYPAPDYDWPRYNCLREKYYWNDFVDVWYWSKTFVNLSYSHNIMGQSFLNAQDGWLSGITLFSMVPNFFQPMSIIITACDEQGVPDHQQCVGRIDLDSTSIQPCYQTPIHAGDIVTRSQVISSAELSADLGGSSFSGILTNANAPGTPRVDVQAIDQGANFFLVTFSIPNYIYPVRVDFNPVFLSAGKRYSFHLVTTFAHQFACSLDPSCYGVHQGDFWDYDGTSWFRVGYNGYKTLRFMLHYLVWGQWQGRQTSQGSGNLRYSVALQPLQLAGGIAGVDVLAEHIIPAATDLSYAVQVAGKWYPFAGDPANPVLSSHPALLPFQVIFTGTTDLMPGVSFTNSQVTLTGASTSSFHHISTMIPRGGGTATGVKVLANVTGWNGAHHTLAGTIHYGSTHMNPSVTSSAPLADGVTTQFTFTFNQTGITNYQVELDGTTDGTGDNFVTSQRSSFSA